jgi:4-aminobutyrate aminotransferase-like enzyme
MRERLNVAEAIQHAGEDESNAIRRQAAAVEPLALRTKTSSLAVLARSEGCYHHTPEGRKLADFTSGVLVANLGHNPTGWWRRLLDYMRLSPPGEDQPYQRAVTLSAYNAVTPLEVEASQRLLANLRDQSGGGRMEQVMWAASGSEAIQKALWTALAQRPESDIMLATRRGFHGKKGLAGAVTGGEQDRDRDPRVRFLSFPTDECRSIERRGQPLDLAPYEAELKALADEYGDRLCCLITEPYLGGGGSYHPQKKYIQLLERFCRERNIAFIFDEVQSNFGRTGEMYAFTHYGVEPDIVVLGKGLGNGVPVDAAVGRADLFAKLGYGAASDTWSGHPLGCAAVLATLDEFERGDVLDHARRLAEVIERNLLRLCELPAIEAVRGEGTVWGVECAEAAGRSAEEIAHELVRRCYLGDERGRAIHLLGPLAGRVLRLAPPLVMPLDEAQEYLDALYGIVEKLGKDK